jgi:hypothetical protein
LAAAAKTNAKIPDQLTDPKSGIKPTFKRWAFFLTIMAKTKIALKTERFTLYGDTHD